MDIKEGYIPFKGYQTYYRIVNPTGKKTPLVILHGGPGSTHNSYELMDHLAVEDDRPFIMYDQLGCGLSFVEGKHDDLFNKEVWVEELENLRKELHLEEVHLLGHSWGGMLEIIYLCDYQPKGVKSCVFSSTLASASLWRQETHRLIGLLPNFEQEAILKAEKKNEFDSLESRLADEDYMHHFVGGPWSKDAPDCLTRTKIRGDEAYLSAWGPCEYSPLGSLKDYEYLDKLHLITCPILLTNGANDESTPLQNKMMYDALTCEKKWVIFANSRHMSYYEEHEKYAKELLSFLNATD